MNLKKILPLLLILASSASFAQTTIVKGRITDLKTGEPIAYAIVGFSRTNIKTVTDFEGNYELFKIDSSFQNNDYNLIQPRDSAFNQNDSVFNLNDSMLIRDTIIDIPDSVYVMQSGFYIQMQEIDKGTINNRDFSLIQEEVTATEGVVISAKVNPAIRIIKLAQEKKSEYNIENVKAYECENFNKIQIAVNYVSDELKSKGIFKKFENEFDTISYLSEERHKQVLPVFISESISDFYYQTSPKKQKEVIKATKIKGVGVDDGTFLSQLLGSTFQQYNFNTNTMEILNKNFVSPISNSSLLYYKYKIVDFTYPDSSGRALYQIRVTPKNPLDLVFTGDIWVEDSSFAIKRLSLAITNAANLNFVEKLKITQELILLPNGSYMPVKNRVLIDIAEISKNAAGMIALFYSSNKNVIVNKMHEPKFFDYPVRVNSDALM
ncbi:MAG: hypothetical protein H7321_05165, partial [Bacteroidia bacterium]|nr:hypothetical protein [Bacteroidia bacterium]